MRTQQAAIPTNSRWLQMDFCMKKMLLCIYEFVLTEKHHCHNLLLIQKVFVESFERHFTLPKKTLGGAKG